MPMREKEIRTIFVGHTIDIETLVYDIAQSCLSDKVLMGFILHLDLTMGDEDFTKRLIKKLQQSLEDAESISKEFGIGEY